MQIAKSRFFVGGLVAVAALFGSAAAQANLIVNGDFETQDFTGWTKAIDEFPPGPDGVFQGFGVGGSYGASFGNPSVSTISQTLATIAGERYSISFYLQNEAAALVDGSLTAFEVDWGGNAVATESNLTAFGYTQYEIFVTATSASTDIAFKFKQTTADDTFWDFDNVDVHLPEPGSLALAGLAGVLALAASRRRMPKSHSVSAAA